MVLALQQRVLPAYRAPFFELLAQACPGGLHLFAGEPRPVEAIATTTHFTHAHLTPAHNRHLFHTRHPLYFCWQDGLIPWLEKTDPHALIVEANPRYLSTPRAIRWMKAHQRPVLGWGLGAPPTASLLARHRARFLAQLDGLIAYSEKGADEYRALHLHPPSHIFTAPNAVTPRPPSPPPSRALSPAHPLTLLFVGRLQTRKRLDLLLHACALLPLEIQPRLVIVGDGPAREAFQALAAQVYPQAEFPGAQHGPALAPYFAAADLFVLPGTGGLAVQEAMSFGLPVIVAEGDGTQNALVRPENGWLVPPGDLSGLRATLDDALSAPARLRQMGAESFRIVSEEINLEAMVQVFLQALSEGQYD
jgi:glycosyltransferase involved in cell wall biosynthesis